MTHDERLEKARCLGYKDIHEEHGRYTFSVFGGGLLTGVSAELLDSMLFDVEAHGKSTILEPDRIQ